MPCVKFIPSPTECPWCSWAYDKNDAAWLLEILLWSIRPVWSVLSSKWWEDEGKQFWFDIRMFSDPSKHAMLFEALEEERCAGNASPFVVVTADNRLLSPLDSDVWLIWWLRSLVSVLIPWGECPLVSISTGPVNKFSGNSKSFPFAILKNSYSFFSEYFSQSDQSYVIPRYVAVERPRLAEVPFCGIFIWFIKDAAIELDDEVDVRSWTSFEICVSWSIQKNSFIRNVTSGKFAELIHSFIIYEIRIAISVYLTCCERAVCEWSDALNMWWSTKSDEEVGSMALWQIDELLGSSLNWACPPLWSLDSNNWFAWWSCEATGIWEWCWSEGIDVISAVKLCEWCVWGDCAVGGVKESSMERCLLFNWCFSVK